jgi:hypothetical protein
LRSDGLVRDAFMGIAWFCEHSCALEAFRSTRLRAALERNARPEIVDRGARALRAQAIATRPAGAKPRHHMRRVNRTEIQARSRGTAWVR